LKYQNKVFLKTDETFTSDVYRYFPCMTTFVLMMDVDVCSRPNFFAKRDPFPNCMTSPKARMSSRQETSDSLKLHQKRLAKERQTHFRKRQKIDHDR
jgi:hypothetical protein